MHHEAERDPRPVGQLQEALAEMRRDLAAARATREAAQHVEADRRGVLRFVIEQIQALERQVLRQSRAVHLQGAASHRGTLILGPEVLRFAGLRERFDVPLAAIQDVQIGRSSLPPRLGIPLIENLWPGEPRETGTLLLSVQSSEGAAPNVVVVAGLADAEGWREDILRQKQQLAAVSQRRAELEERRARAEAALDAAIRAREQAAARLDSLQQEVAGLEGEIRRAQRNSQRSDSSESGLSREEPLRPEPETIRRPEES